MRRPSGLCGTYNATGETMRFDDLLEECRRATGSDASFTWVASEVLLAEGVEEWMGVPLWIATDGWQAANRVVVDRALAAGLTFRPLGETVLGALRQASRSTASA